MTDVEDLPTGSHKVCPRCGTPPGTGTWCSECGLNLQQQQELPTANAYSARVREEQWLADQELQHQAEREAGEREAAASRDQRRAEAERRKVDARERKATKQEWRETKPSEGRRSRHALLAAVIAGLLLMLTAGAVAYVLVSGDEPSERADREPPTSFAAGDQAQEAEPSSPPEDDSPDGAASDGSSAAVTGTLEECADFKTAGPFVEDIEALGIGCSEATQFITAWEEDGPGTSGSCAGPDGVTAYPCEYQGWTCDSIQSGYESSAFDCSKGDATVRWESGF